MLNVSLNSALLYNKGDSLIIFEFMKKFFVFLLGILFALQTSVAFAQDSIISNSAWLTSRAARQVAGAERWLYRMNFEGINYLNDNFIQAKALAQAWDHDAQPYGMHVFFPSVQGGNCMFEYGSKNKPGMIYTVYCKTPASADTGSAMASASMDPDKLFPFTSMYPFRRFISQVLSSKDVMDEITRTFKTGGNQIGLQSLTFDYGIVDGKYSWTAQLTAQGMLSMDIYGDIDTNGGIMLTTQQM